MARQKRNWFIEGTIGSAGTKFLTGNLPTQEMFTHLRDSTPFFLEEADAATLTQRGLIYKASDADCLIWGNFGKADTVGQVSAVMPRQLPDVGAGRTIPEPIAQNQIESANGIKITKYTVTSGPHFRRAYDVAVDYSTIPRDAGLIGKYLLLVDQATHAPTLTDIIHFTQYITRNEAGDLTAGGYKLDDVGGLGLSDAEIISKDTTSTEFTITAANKVDKGQSITITAGKSLNNDDGGDINLVPGQSDSYTRGGDLNLTGGRSLVGLGGDVNIDGGIGEGYGEVHLGALRASVVIGSATRGEGTTNPTQAPSSFIATTYGNTELKGSLKAVSAVFSKGIILGDSLFTTDGALRFKDGVPQIYISGWKDVALSTSVPNIAILDTSTEDTDKVWSASKLTSSLEEKSDTTHDHDSVYLSTVGTAYNSTRLNGQLAAYYATQTDLASAVSAAALGIKYSWADVTARDAQTGHAIGEMGIIETVANRPVYRANSVAAGASSWDLAFYMDASHTHAYSTITSPPVIPANISDLAEDALSRHVTDTMISTWNGKANAVDVYTKTAADLLLGAKAEVDDTATNTTDTWSSSKISTQLGLKSDSSHVHDADAIAATATRVWVTPAEKVTWNAKSTFDGAYASLTGEPFVVGTDIVNAGSKKVLIEANHEETALSTLDVDGSLGLVGKSYTCTSNFNIPADTTFIYVTGGTGAGSAILPTASTATRRTYFLINSSGVTLTIGRQAGETINGGLADSTLLTGKIALIHAFGTDNWNVINIG